MKNLKKVLALVLSLAMIVSTFTVSFAAEEKTDAEIATALGMIEGDGNGVTDEYLEKSTTRLQAAIMFLRLKGLEETAQAFEGTENFSDADEVKWAPGKAMLAYLKANPELGWVGTGDGFMPNAPITAQAYYKVMLEAIGYEYKVDFDWAEVLEFAATKGLSAAADVEDFTNNDIAVVTVETLKAENSEGVKLINALVEDGTITDLETAELVDYVAPVTAKMTAAKAIDATTVMVSFDEAIEVTADDFAVVAGDKDMAVSAVTSADAGKVAVLTVAELTVGSKYTVTFGEVSKTVVPTIKDDKTKPVIKSAESITGAVVSVTLSTRNINKDTLVAENFSLNNDATVLSVELNVDAMKKAENVGKTVLTLGVTGLKAGKAYVVTSTGVTSYEGLVADESKATFAGKDADTKAPKLAGAVSDNGYQVLVTFTEDVKLDETTATDISNYSITPELEITEAKIEENVVGGNTVVRLTTAFQKSGTAYTLKVDNISDGTNVMKEAAKTIFAGKKKPDNQKATGALATDATKVEVTFESETNDTALDITNYSINKDIEVVAAEYLEDTSADKLNKKKVILTTTEMKSGNAYIVTVGTGVQDVLGQGLKESKKLTFAGMDKDKSFSTSNSASSIDKNKIKVEFGEKVDVATATDVANYSISDLGYPSEVSLDSTGMIATLTVQDQTAGKEYTITINNVQDKAGNTIKADTKVTFTGKGDIVTVLKVTGAEALTTDFIKVTFNQKVTGDADTNDFVLTNKSTSDTYTFNDPTNITVAQDYIILQLATASTKMDASHVYEIKLSDSANHLTGSPTGHNYSSKEADLKAQLVGTDSTKAQFEIASVEVIDQTHIKITLEEAVVAALTPTATNINVYSDSDYSNLADNADDVEICSAKATDAGIWSPDNKSVVLTTEAKFDNNGVYYVQFEGLTTFKTVYGATLKEYKKDTGKARFQVVTGSLSAATATKLDITNAQMLDKNTLEVTFNVDTNKALEANVGDVMLVKEDDDTTDVASVTKVIFSDERTARVYFTGETALDNDNGIHYVYIANNNLKSKIGNSHNWNTGDRYASFAKVTTKNAAPKISLVEPLADSLLKVTISEPVLFSGSAIGTDDEAFVIYNEDTTTPIDDSDYTIAPASTNKKEFFVTLANGVFVEGANYRIGLKDEVEGVDEIVSAKEYVTTSTDYSIKFGGTASAFVPTITSAVWNATNLVITGTGFDTDYTNDVTKIEVADIALAGTLTVDSATQITVSTITNRTAIEAAMGTEGMLSDKIEVLADWSIDKAGNKAPAEAATGNSVLFDATVPVVTSVTSGAYNKTTGILTLTVVGATATNDIVDVTKITLKDSDDNLNTDQGSYVLTDSTGVVTDGTTLTITLSATDKAKVNTIDNSAATITVDVATAAIKDTAGNVNAEVADTANVVTVTQ